MPTLISRLLWFVVMDINTKRDNNNIFNKHFYKFVKLTQSVFFVHFELYVMYFFYTSEHVTLQH